MWPLLSGLWKARRGRKAAVAVIMPFVERSRQQLGQIPDSAWLDPYLVGFMMMLITLVARRDVEVLDTQALALVQCTAWGEITGLKPDLVGEETLHLCATSDREFERGCRDAMEIDLALYKSLIVRNSDLGFSRVHEGFRFHLAGEAVPDLDNIMALWDRFVDAQLMGHVAADSIVRGIGNEAVHSPA